MNGLAQLCLLILMTMLPSTHSQDRYFIQTSSTDNFRLVCRQCGCPKGGRLELWDKGQWNAVSICSGFSIVLSVFEGTCTSLFPGSKVHDMWLQEQLSSAGRTAQDVSVHNVTEAKRIFFLRIGCNSATICDCLGSKTSFDSRGCGKKPSPHLYSLDVYLQCDGRNQASTCQNVTDPWAPSQNPPNSTTACTPAANGKQAIREFTAAAGRTIGIVAGSWAGIFLVVFLYSRYTDIPLRPLSVYGMYSRIFGETMANQYLAEDFVNNKVVFFNNILQDGFLFWRCEHPLFTAWPPRGHPFSRSERLIVAFVSWAVSSLILAASFVVWGTSQNMVATFVIFVYGTIPSFLVSYVLKQCAICTCCLGKNADDCCKKCGTCCSRFSLGCGCCCGLISFIGFLLYAGILKQFGPLFVLSIGALVGNWALLENLKVALCFLRHRRNEMAKNADFHLTHEKFENDYCIENGEIMAKEITVKTPIKEAGDSAVQSQNVVQMNWQIGETQTQHAVATNAGPSQGYTVQTHPQVMGAGMYTAGQHNLQGVEMGGMHYSQGYQGTGPAGFPQVPNTYYTPAYAYPPVHQVQVQPGGFAPTV